MLVFNQALANGNTNNLRNMASQYAMINAHRSDARHALNPQMFANVGSNPTDLYRDWDNTTVRQFHLDEGDAILNRLLPLARSLPIGRMVSEYGRASGMGGFQTSMSGEIEAVHDKVDYDLDGTLIPVHQNGFKTGWREQSQLSLDGFDDAMVKQAESVRTHRKGLINYLLNGTTDVYKTYSWAGFKADTRVDQVDLSSFNSGVNFVTDTGADIVEGMRLLASRRMVTNKIGALATYFVSYEIWFKWQEDYSTAKGDNTILERVQKLPTVGEIVPSSVLSGNQVLSMVLDTNYIQPLVGQGVSTIALARPNYNSPYAFDTVSVMGIQIKRDNGNTNTAVQYAAS